MAISNTNKKNVYVMDEAQGVAHPCGRVFQHPLVCISFWLPQLPLYLVIICLPTTLSCYHACVHLSIHLSTLFPTKTHHSINSATRSSPIHHLLIHLPSPCSFTHLHNCPSPSTLYLTSSPPPIFSQIPSLLSIHLALG